MQHGGDDGRVNFTFTPRQLGPVDIEFKVHYIGKQDTSAPSMGSPQLPPRQQSNHVNTAFYGSRSNGSPDLGETEHPTMDITELQKDEIAPQNSTRKRECPPEVTKAVGKKQKIEDI
ncbi:hypothetical protein S40288_11791 [Stachybotrys chartarum IBT 40288]|nr:hypothetical protein S40288_11791 [Stachybotrys chartarum IBT 40288]